MTFNNKPLDNIIDIESDGEEDARLDAEWAPTNWIACGKLYKDAPNIVSVARKKLLAIPEHIVALHFPNPLIPISEFLLFRFPVLQDDVDSGRLKPDADGSDFYEKDPEEISDNINNMLVPSTHTLDILSRCLGQAWFDGKKSIRVWNDETFSFGLNLPFWVITYWMRVHTLKGVQEQWMTGKLWLESAMTSPEEISMGSRVRDIMEKIGWDGWVLGNTTRTDVRVEELSDFLSDRYLTGGIVDAMTTLLVERLVQSPGEGKTTFIATTYFSNCIASATCFGASVKKGKA